MKKKQETTFWEDIGNWWKKRKKSTSKKKGAAIWSGLVKTLIIVFVIIGLPYLFTLYSFPKKPYCVKDLNIGIGQIKTIKGEDKSITGDLFKIPELFKIPQELNRYTLDIVMIPTDNCYPDPENNSTLEFKSGNVEKYDSLFVKEIENGKYEIFNGRGRFIISTIDIIIHPGLHWACEKEIDIDLSDISNFEVCIKHENSTWRTKLLLVVIFWWVLVSSAITIIPWINKMIDLIYKKIKIKTKK